MDTKKNIKSLTHEELCDLFASLKQPSFRVKQLEEWLYGKDAGSFDEMTNLPAVLREKLESMFTLEHAKVTEKLTSIDGSRKYLFEFSDGIVAESVGMPSEDGKRLSVCFSTQAGCAMACAFCATGKSGFRRNLCTGEIYDQIVQVGKDFNIRPSSVVAMGQGEPFANYKAVMGALYYVNRKDCLGIGARHITVSTCGLSAGINRFAHEPYQYTLAVSLHSAIQETRDVLMPGVKGNSLDDLRVALKHYTEKTKRRPSLEYTLIKDLNDDKEHLEALVSFCKSLLCHVNIIPLNSVGNTLFKPSPAKKTHQFALYLKKEGIETTIRKSRGQDIAGACGQLASKKLQS